MSWKPEVIADSTGRWIANGLRFATREECEQQVAQLKWSWTAVQDTRVVECDDAVTAKFANGKLEVL